MSTRSLAREKIFMKPGPEPKRQRVTWPGAYRPLVRDDKGSVRQLALDGAVQTVLPEPKLAPCDVSAQGSVTVRLVAVVDLTCQIGIWDAASATFRYRARLPAVADPRVAPDRQMSWSPADDLLAVIPAGGTLQIRNEKGEIVRESSLGGAVSSDTGIRWSSDGEFLAMGNGNLHLLRIRDGEELTLALFEGDTGPRR